MHDKKVWEVKRKTNDMILRIHENTREFPTDFLQRVSVFTSAGCCLSTSVALLIY